jgi:hypothetical protein
MNKNKYLVKPEAGDSLTGCIDAVVKVFPESEGLLTPKIDFPVSETEGHCISNRQLEAMCGLAYLAEHGQSESIFGGQDKVYHEEDIDVECVDSTAALEQFFRIMYAPGKYRSPEEERAYLGVSASFARGILKGNAVFSKQLNNLVYNFLEMRGIDTPKNVKELFEALDDKWVDFLHECGSQLEQLAPRKFQWIYGQLMDKIWSCPEFSGTLSVVSESSTPWKNWFSADKAGSCTLGNNGANYHVCIQEEIDPHMGKLVLRAGAYSGRAYIIEVESEGERYWLVDGADSGLPMRQSLYGPASSALFKGILKAAQDANIRPAGLLINMHVTNPFSNYFANFCSVLGSQRELFVKKIGGSTVLDELGKYVNLFSDRDGIRGEHFIESLHYRQDGSGGSVWSKSCEGYARVNQISFD